MPEATQQASNPTAYSALQTYKQGEALYDILTAINGDMMTVSHSLEQQTLPQGSTPSHTDVNFDNNPAPHHLSP
ncbi:hypothetical protein ACQCN2_20875 [Brevibacillus ginsengisoli]|uniref:hypothetical protein n=1 Tax=Brevibacillus ginsengisoli TaxID=363854 RepID=UPI003CE6A002